MGYRSRAIDHLQIALKGPTARCTNELRKVRNILIGLMIRQMQGHAGLVFCNNLVLKRRRDLSESLDNALTSAEMVCSTTGLLRSAFTV